ncbi:MAG: hypothetical protein ACLQVY_28645 [Limisphaerales bacterium]
MTLRFEVNQAEAFRRGINVPKSTCHLDVDPTKLSPTERNLIAMRLEGIDVCQLDESGRKMRRNPQNGQILHADDETGDLLRVVADLPTLDALLESVKENQKYVMLQFTVKPLHDSDWSGIHDAQVDDKVTVIHCKAGPGRNLPAVRAGQTYAYRGKYPARFVMPGDTTAAAMPVFSVYEVEDGLSSYEVQATLLDKAGKEIVWVKIEFWPVLKCGGFRLPPTANVGHVLKNAATVHAEDGKQYRLTNVHHCTAFHLMSPDKAHIEFDFEPIES